MKKKKILRIMSYDNKKRKYYFHKNMTKEEVGVQFKIIANNLALKNQTMFTMKTRKALHSFYRTYIYKVIKEILKLKNFLNLSFADFVDTFESNFICSSNLFIPIISFNNEFKNSLKFMKLSEDEKLYLELKYS